MGYHRERRSYYNKGISYTFKDSSPVIVNAAVYIPVKFNFDKHEPIIRDLCDKLEIKSCIYHAREKGKYTLGITFTGPFRGSEVLAISYRKRLSRVIKSIVNYDNNKIDFLTKYINHWVSVDHKFFYGT